MRPEEIKEWVEEGGEYLEIFRAVLPYIKEVGTEIKPLLENVVKFHVEATCFAFDKYIDYGFSREEAMQLVLQNKQEVSEFIKNVQYTKS